ncbi:transposase [Microbacterium oxydans]|nr:transposase [Microbacterium oxydans]
MNQKYSPEMREKALRMLDEAKPSHPNLMTAVRHVAGLLGMSAETLRVWHRRREVDGGQRPGVPTDVAEENKRLRRENAELRKANGSPQSRERVFREGTRPLLTGLPRAHRFRCPDSRSSTGTGADHPGERPEPSNYL